MNIVLMVVDSLRADHLSCYGYKGIETPNIDAFARKSSLFTSAFSMGSQTHTSIPYILSPQMLRGFVKRGFVPVLIHNNVNVRRAKPPLIEFDLYRHRKRFRRIATYLFKGNWCPWRRAEYLNDIGKSIIEMYEGEKRVFLCLWYMETHLPYYPPNGPGFIDKVKRLRLNNKLRKSVASRNYSQITKRDIEEIIKLYDGEILYFDSCFGKFLKHLDECIVILTADHGEEFMERGDLGHQNKNIACLRHVPLIVKHPNREPQIIRRHFYFSKFKDKMFKWVK